MCISSVAEVSSSHYLSSKMDNTVCFNHKRNLVMKFCLRNVIGITILGMLSANTFASDENEYGQSQYKVELVPLNGSGVYGEVDINLREGKMLSVSVSAMGLEAEKIHPQHIHGFNKPVSEASCPGIESDSNGDGIISLSEALPSFGPIVLPLVPFDLVDAMGNLEYQATFTINPGSLQPLHKRAIVLHGMTVNGKYIPSLPVACGVIVRTDDSGS